MARSAPDQTPITHSSKPDFSAKYNEAPTVTIQTGQAGPAKAFNEDKKVKNKAQIFSMITPIILF